MIHTQQRGQKPLKAEVPEKPHFTHSLLVEPQPHTLCCEAALTTHDPFFCQIQQVYVLISNSPAFHNLLQAGE